jgi:hypothetical protein
MIGMYIHQHWPYKHACAAQDARIGTGRWREPCSKTDTSNAKPYVGKAM